MGEQVRLHPSRRWASLLAVPLLAGLLVPAATPAQAAEPKAAAAAQVLDVDDLPDPLDRGMYTPRTIQEVKLGTASLQEPDSAGGAPNPNGVSAAEDLEIRGALYYPDFSQRTAPSPLIVLVHGNHGSCDVNAPAGTTTPTCATYKRNEAGYAYLGENLASWGYTVYSVSQDQLMLRQDNSKGKGMHQRRLLIAASLDALSAANAGTLVNGEHVTVGSMLTGKLDMTRIGLMGHSRGGDAVTSFIDYNRTRTDGPRYPLRGVIALAPVDYERKAPYGTPFMSILPFCDGDVSNLQGARFFERSQYINGNDPFPRVQSSQLGAIHNWYNSVWYADGGADGQANNDAACGNSAPFATNNVHPNNIRLSGAADPATPAKNYALDNSDTYNPQVNTKISGDPSRMGDQEKIGLATMSAFFRRYVGGEGAFDAYLTGELSDTATHQQIPTSACPTSVSATRIGCEEYVSTNYFPPASERVDVIRPEVSKPLTLNALGGSLSGSGFANPYLDGGGVTPTPKTTTGGYDWCNPEPDDFAPAQLGKGTLPTAAKACPLPSATALGGQSNGMRENAPVNHSYGGQLALAWEAGKTAELTADIPAASGDVSGLKALSLSADVNFFDTRNPGADNRGDNTRDTTSTGCTAALPCWPNEKPTSFDTTSTTQDFLIALKDTKGKEATVHAGDERWGNALHMSTGTNTPNTHIVLDQIRVPLSEFAAQGVDISSLDKVELRFGETGTPQSGSIQVADVRFQEAADEKPLILSDGTAVNQGAGSGKPATGPDPADFLAQTDNTPGKVKLVDTVANKASNNTWVVDNDKKQCPDANFTSIQKAVDFAAPWDTIVVCEGVYEESSTPVSGAGNPVGTNAKNGLTITKPLKIKGAGADKVTIMPDQSLDSLAGLKPYLRDGGGNVITASRQSLGSTDTTEMFVDISGVTVTSGDVFAEAGIAFFGAAGRVSKSVVGPLKVASNASELAENPHGWGIVKTGVIQGAGKGTVETEVTVANSLVTGYQSGGILFDGARGTDGTAANTVRAGLRNHGYVTGTVVKGKPNSLFAQTGIKYTSGMDGFVNGSRITGNYLKTDPSKSFGLLLTDARTETAGALTAAGNVITGNGFAVYNANADNTAVREGAPFTISGSYLGTSAPVSGGPANPDTGAEAVSGPDTTRAATVTVASRATSTLAAVPTAAGTVTDDAPSAAVVDPGQGTTVKVGETVTPLVRARDDFAVESATLFANGWPVASTSSAPYSFSWTAPKNLAGKDVELSAVVTDSSGQTTVSDVVTVSVSKESVPPAPAPAPAPVLKPTLKLEKVVKKPSKGRSTVYAKVNTAGRVQITGSKVATDSVRSRGASTVKITLKPNKAQRKVLNKKGKVTVTFRLRFTSSAGKTVSLSRTVVITKK
jgi:hypothetical protein